MRLSSRLKNEFSFLRGNILVMIASWLLMNFAGAIPSVYYSLYVLELGGTPFIIGIIGSISFLVLALVQFTGGYLADKHGRRWLIVTFTFGLVLSNLFFVLAPSWHFVLFGVMLQNLFLVYQPALLAIIADSIPRERRGMGFSMLGFVNNIAAIFSPAIAGLLYVQHGLVTSVRIAYLMVVFFNLAAAFIRVKLTETLQGSSERISLRGVVKEYPKMVKEGLSVWKFLPRSMFFLFVTNAISSFIYAMSMPYQVVYATKVLKIPEFSWAIIMTWYTAAMIISALPSGKLTDRFGRKSILFISWVFLALFPVLFLLGDFSIVLGAFLMFGISNALFGAAYPALEADLVPRELRGKEAGCSQFIMYALMSIGGLVGGFVYEFVSPMLLFILAFIVTIPCALITQFFIYEPEKRQT